jgi:hypothetical protein
LHCGRALEATVSVQRSKFRILNKLGNLGDLPNEKAKTKKKTVLEFSESSVD